MNFAGNTLNSAPINGALVSNQTLMTQPAVLTRYAAAAIITSDTLGLTGIVVPYENRTGRPPYENRVLRIPRGL